jgi:hypothetical protein
MNTNESGGECKADVHGAAGHGEGKNGQGVRPAWGVGCAGGCAWAVGGGAVGGVSRKLLPAVPGSNKAGGPLPRAQEWS